MISAATRRSFLALASLALSTSLVTVPALAAETTLSFLIDNAPSTVAWANQLKTDFEAANPDIKIEVEQRPGGADGDNLIKTKLATGDMSDVFNYNAGSLFQQINPTQ